MKELEAKNKELEQLFIGLWHNCGADELDAVTLNMSDEYRKLVGLPAWDSEERKKKYEIE
jgi:hypothetical protein